MNRKHSAESARALIPYLVEECCQLSDAQPDALASMAEHLVTAHEAAPGGMTIEVGTRAGGSALILAKLLDYLYREPPVLLTVDPYGLKPYLGGDHAPADHLRPYGDGFYSCAKSVLANFPNHAHYLLEAMPFFRSLKGESMWHRGVRLPFRHSASFVFLDGNHDAASVLEEVAIVRAEWLRPRGLIYIDNALNDPRLRQALAGDQAVTFMGREWASVQG